MQLIISLLELSQVAALMTGSAAAAAIAFATVQQAPLRQDVDRLSRAIAQLPTSTQLDSQFRALNLKLEEGAMLTVEVEEQASDPCSNA